MGSTGKRKTTMAKLNRESKLHEKRVQKQARKAARKLNEETDAAVALSRDGSAAPSHGLDETLPDGEGPQSLPAE